MTMLREEKAFLRGGGGGVHLGNSYPGDFYSLSSLTTHKALAVPIGQKLPAAKAALESARIDTYTGCFLQVYCIWGKR